MEQLISAKIKELTDNGKLDEIVTKRATEFINSMLQDALASYGDVQKKYREKLNQSLLNGMEQLDFIQYSKTLTDLIEAELNKTIVSAAIQPVKNMIQEFTGELEKRNWKLSEIIEKFKEQEVIPDEHGQSGEIAFVHEQSTYGTIYIAFDKESKGKNQRYQCKYRLMIEGKTNKLYSPNVDGMSTHPIKEFAGLFGFDLFLFKLYAMQCTIECDINSVETEWSTFD